MLIFITSIILSEYAPTVFSEIKPLTLSVIVEAVTVPFINIVGVFCEAAST